MADRALLAGYPRNVIAPKDAKPSADMVQTACFLWSVNHCHWWLIKILNLVCNGLSHQSWWGDFCLVPSQAPSLFRCVKEQGNSLKILKGNLKSNLLQLYAWVKKLVCMIKPPSQSRIHGYVPVKSKNDRTSSGNFTEVHSLWRWLNFVIF